MRNNPRGYMIAQSIRRLNGLSFFKERIETLLLKSRLARYVAMKLTFLLPNSWARFVRIIYAEQESLRTVALFLNKAPFETINIVDVGCYKGGFLKRFKAIVRKRIFSVGIDPIRYPHKVQYSVFVEKAVANQSDGIRSFYEYSDPTFSSLKELVKHPKTLSMRTVRTVRTARLSSIIKQLGMENEIIHFLKIDVQGSDLEAFLSLQEYVKNCLFVQLETLLSKDGNVFLYKNQTTFRKEKPIIESLGFELFSFVLSGSVAAPTISKFGMNKEADVIFINKKLVRRLQLERLLRSIIKD